MVDRAASCDVLRCVNGFRIVASMDEEEHCIALLCTCARQSFLSRCECLVCDVMTARVQRCRMSARVKSACTTAAAFSARAWCAGTACNEQGGTTAPCVAQHTGRAVKLKQQTWAFQLLVRVGLHFGPWRDAQ
mmetsp:Transcript_27331/g.83064  ORF Transcript_27331/g.83064 Transcript_27331/m.83064 type:complete len:133 (-) Transcript_27331:9-407(-)|eukprot:scaffold188692_cov33-Tisochrysis_lutea.AAC.1